MKNEEQHIEIREKLLKLPRVKVRKGFENELLRRINLLDTETFKPRASKSSFWESLFGKRSLAWTIPATSLAVIVIVFVGVYFAFYNSKDEQQKSEDKSSVNQLSNIESLKINPLTQESSKNDILGKDIVNDLEISKSPNFESKSDLDKGLNETFVLPSPKPIVPSKINVIDSKKESTIYEKAEDVGKTGKSIKPSDETESGVSKGKLNKDKKTEEPSRSKEPENKISSPLIKDVDKIKTEKSEIEKKEKIETKNKEDAKVKEEVKRKEEARIKEEVKRKEEARIKEEVKRKEEARIKEEVKRKEEARIKEEVKRKEEARRREEARIKEEAKRKEELKKKEELEKLKEKIKDN